MVIRASGPRRESRFAVLSYHSWDARLEAVANDIRYLRERGWRFVSAGEASAFLTGSSTGNDARLALVTTDDGHEADVGFRDTLRREGCPGVTFVNVGLLPAERRAWYRETHSDEWSVQDHGELHRRHFVSGHLTDVFHGQKIGGLEYMSLPVGAPLLASSGELASPRFDPDPDAIALAARWAEAAGRSVIASESWITELSERLVRARVAYRWRGRTYLKGTLESQEAFESRVMRAVGEGRLAFEEALGHAPTMFAYPWWQGSGVADRELAASGYAATFAGINRLQPAGMSAYSVPRVVIGPGVSRPLDLDAIGDRSHPDWTIIRGHVQRAAKRLLGVI